MQDQLLSLGWDVTDDAGSPGRLRVFPRKKYHFRLYYKVLAPIPGEWETFIHIDGFHRRFNGDHKTLGGKYSFSLWQTGDYIVDDSEFSLEPNFTRGDYNVYYGLFVGETRLKVKTGPHEDNRIDGGKLHVVQLKPGRTVHVPARTRSAWCALGSGTGYAHGTGQFDAGGISNCWPATERLSTAV